jgi:hypothetical protein
MIEMLCFCLRAICAIPFLLLYTIFGTIAAILNEIIICLIGEEEESKDE